jgi:sterol desaturase/sphingolipid hydroxylase (fatty acid hydroxylase superfamily)
VFTLSEPVLYSYIFFAACMIAGEWWGRRPNVLPWHQRWLTNLALHATVLGTGRLLATGTVFALAIEAHAADTGILPFLNTPPVLAFTITFVAFDLFTFLLHRLLHRVPWFWRFHAIHHTDTEFDSTTHYRHHPLEDVITTAFYSGFVWALGPDPFALVCASAAHQFNSLFNHSNIALPPALDRVFRRVFVTPDMHRIHHSSRREETDSNFGNLFSGWDRLFGCYVHEPQGGQSGFDLGLLDYREPQRLTLWGLLKGPFVQASRIKPATVDTDTKTFPGDLY